MKLIILFLSILSFCIEAKSTQFSLVKIDDNSFKTYAQKIVKVIEADDTKQEALPFDKEQSFFLKNHEEQKIGYFIPVKFSSKIYKNTICRLYFVDTNNNLKYAELFAEKNNGEDIVSSCVGIEAVSIQETMLDELNYLALLRYRTVNTYSSKGIVVKYKNGNLHYDQNLTDCISAKGEIRKISDLRRRLSSCR